MTSCCKPCDTQPRMAPLIASISPGSPGIFLPVGYLPGIIKHSHSKEVLCQNRLMIYPR